MKMNFNFMNSAFAGVRSLGAPSFSTLFHVYFGGFLATFLVGASQYSHIKNRIQSQIKVDAKPVSNLSLSLSILAGLVSVSLSWPAFLAYQILSKSHDEEEKPQTQETVDSDLENVEAESETPNWEANLDPEVKKWVE